MGRTEQEAGVVRTRDWITEAKAEAEANTARHEEQFNKNWSHGDYKGCCKSVDPCEVHAELRAHREPCEGCSLPTPPDPEWEHNLCTDCVLSKPQDFLDYLKGRVLCMGEIKSLKAQIAYLQDLREKTRVTK